MPRHIVSGRSLGLRIAFAVSLLLAASACARVPQAPDPSTRDIAKALSNKTLSHESGARVYMGRDGSISGSGMAGSWWVSGKSVCRTLVAPTNMIGTTCQDVHFAGDRVAFRNPAGHAMSFRIED